MGKETKNPTKLAKQKAQAEEAHLQAQAEQEARLKVQALEEKRLKIVEAVKEARKVQAEQETRLKAIADEEARLKAIADEEARLKAIADEEAADAEYDVLENPVAPAINAVVNGNNTSGNSNVVSLALPTAGHTDEHLTVVGKDSAASSGGGWLGSWFDK